MLSSCKNFECNLKCHVMLEVQDTYAWRSDDV